jgi:hypothetical protein
MDLNIGYGGGEFRGSETRWVKGDEGLKAVTKISSSGQVVLYHSDGATNESRSSGKLR